MDRFLSYYLPAFVLAYLLVTFVWPSLRVYRQTGINPLRFGRRDNAHDYIGGVMKGLTGALAAAVFLAALSPAGYRYLQPFGQLEGAATRWAGLVLVHFSLFWIVLAQRHMDRSWRIGIDEEHRTELVTHGLFGISRNPVFLGMLGSTLGIFLILPNALTLLVTVVSYVVIQIQIRLEEEHLLRQHGAVYADYRQRVRRLL